MKQTPLITKAFSMIELLLALAIAAVVVGIIAPRFLNIQQRAKDIVATNMAADLNDTYGDWLNAGGLANNNNGATSNALLAMNGTDNSDFKNGGTSSNFKFPLPASVLSSLNPNSPTPVVNINGVAVAFDPTTGKWAAADLPADGSAVEVGGYVVALNPGNPNGTPFFTSLANLGYGGVVTLGSNLVTLDPSGNLQQTNTSSVTTASTSMYNPPFDASATLANGGQLIDNGTQVVGYGYDPTHGFYIDYQAPVIGTIQDVLVPPAFYTAGRYTYPDGTVIYTPTAFVDYTDTSGHTQRMQINLQTSTYLGQSGVYSWQTGDTLLGAGNYYSY